MEVQTKVGRRQTRTCRVGAVEMGSGHHVVVQSMVTEETRNVEAVVEQAIALHRAGSEIVRVTTPSMGEAKCLEEITGRRTPEELLRHIFSRFCIGK